MSMDIAAHEAWFGQYVDRFLTGNAEHDGHIELKREHSLLVLGHARAIVAEAVAAGAMDVVSARAALLGALYHDMGRFPQYRRWRTFSDARSTNHGLLGGRTLNEERPLRDEAPAVRRLAACAVVLHNRFAIPAGVSPRVRQVTRVVRDADKLDIFRVLAAHMRPGGPRDEVVVLHLPELEGQWTPAILEAVRAGRLASYADMRCMNDFRILLCGWSFDLGFAASRRLLRESGRVEQLLAWLPSPEVVPQMAELRCRVLAALHDDRDAADCHPGFVEAPGDASDAVDDSDAGEPVAP